MLVYKLQDPARRWGNVTVEAKLVLRESVRPLR